jgi:hypothetical protein
LQGQAQQQRDVSAQSEVQAANARHQLIYGSPMPSGGSGYLSLFTGMANPSASAGIMGGLADKAGILTPDSVGLFGKGLFG